MKILFVAENLLYGGREKRLIDLANALAIRNFDVSILLYGTLIQLDDHINKNINIVKETVRVEKQNWFYRNVFYRLKCVKAINKTLSKSNYDIIISFDDNVNLNLLLSSGSKNSKVLLSERGDPNSNKLYLKIAKKILYRNANGIVFQTEGAQSFFSNLDRIKKTIIPNPVPFDKDNFDQYNGVRKKTIVNVARLEIFQKRQDILISAFKEFLKYYDDYELILYGDGPDKLQLEELIERYKLEDSVHLAGQQSDIINKISDASFFVLSSDFEGMPNALIEAMAAGLPVISTDCSPGGARDLISNGVNGLLVESGNFEELAKAMIYLAENPLESEKMGKRAMEITEKFDRDLIYSQWEKFIRNL